MYVKSFVILERTNVLTHCNVCCHQFCCNTYCLTSQARSEIAKFKRQTTATDDFTLFSIWPKTTMFYSPSFNVFCLMNLAISCNGLFWRQVWPHKIIHSWDTELCISTLQLQFMYCPSSCRPVVLPAVRHTEVLSGGDCWDNFTPLFLLSYICHTVFNMSFVVHK